MNAHPLIYAQKNMAESAQLIRDVLAKQKGVLFARPAIVYRQMYAGRDIIAKNSKFESGYMDNRGYLPVEWWIMSKTHAKNPINLEYEGMTCLFVGDEEIHFSLALTYAGKDLLGSYVDKWPLTKLLDIGGVPVVPQYSDNMGILPAAEVPPIPCHVHAGEVVDGHCVPPGKSEAYFFPPTNMPPYNLDLTGTITRLGLKPGVSKDEVVNGLKKFGKNDDLYKLLNVYEVSPWESWFIKEKAIHAPGPWPTFEIQRPQDDFNLFAWKLGAPIEPGKLDVIKADNQMKNFPDEMTLVEETVDWELNSKWEKSSWFKKCDIIEQGDWGCSRQLFYHMFYGEGYVVEPGKIFKRHADVRPFAGIVWSGAGYLNESEINSANNYKREFLITPNTEVTLENTDLSLQLIVFVIFPMKL